MKQIFVVEDDHGIRELLEFLLISEDYSVQSFPTAEEFNTRISTHRPDLILLDIMLPDGNGLEMCKVLNGNPETNRIPIVLMSAHADKNLMQEECANDFIAKPFDIDDLLARIENQLG